MKMTPPDATKVWEVSLCGAVNLVCVLCLFGSCVSRGHTLLHNLQVCFPLFVLDCFACWSAQQVVISMPPPILQVPVFISTYTYFSQFVRAHLPIFPRLYFHVGLTFLYFLCVTFFLIPVSHYNYVSKNDSMSSVCLEMMRVSIWVNILCI